MTPQTYEQFQETVKHRKRERWLRILAAEKPGRVPSRRPRDPLQEKLLLQLDRARLERRARAAATGEGGTGEQPRDE